MPRVSGLVSLLTDFGLDDSYAGQMHAAIAVAAPDIRVIDVTHAVPRGDISAALFHAETAWPAFPEGSAHVAIVDPGVGTDRALLALGTPRGFLVGPDNGVLSAGLPTAARPAHGLERRALPEGVRAVEISESPVRAAHVSRTFHGRDVIAPVAARLAAGDPLEALGRPLEFILIAASPAAVLSGGAGAGRVLQIDRFGNAITSVRSSDAPAQFRLTIGAHEIAGPAQAYGLEPMVVVVPGSSGYLEIAVAQGDAAAELNLGVGDELRIEPL